MLDPVRIVRNSRVLHIASYLPLGSGGLELAAWKIADGVALLGWDVQYAVCVKDSVQIPESSFQVVEVNYVDLFKEKTGLPAPIPGPIGIGRIVRAAKWAGIIHVHDALYAGSIIGTILARLLDKPLVITVHTSKLKYRNSLLNLLFLACDRIISRKIMRSASAIIFVGETARRYHLPKMKKDARASVIENGVDSSLFYQRDSVVRGALRSSYNIGASSFVVAYVGRFVEKKGLELMREAAAALEHTTWLFVGDGPLHPDQWKLSNVLTLGVKSQLEVAEVLSLSDVVVCLGEGEGGQTLVVKEAVACGVAVIASREIASAAPFPESAWAGVIDPSSSVAASALIAAIESCSTSICDGTRDSAAERNPTRDWTAVSLDYDQVYRQVFATIEARRP